MLNCSLVRVCPVVPRSATAPDPASIAPMGPPGRAPGGPVGALRLSGAKHQIGPRPSRSDARCVTDRRTCRQRSLARGYRRSPAASPAARIGTPSCRPGGRLARSLAASVSPESSAICALTPSCWPACHRERQAHFSLTFLTVLPKLLFTIRGTICDNCTRSMRGSSSRSGGGCLGCSRRFLACGVDRRRPRRLKTCGYSPDTINRTMNANKAAHGLGEEYRGIESVAAPHLRWNR